MHINKKRIASFEIKLNFLKTFANEQSLVMFLMVPQHSKPLIMGMLVSSKSHVIVSRCTEGVTVLRIPNVVEWWVDDGTVDSEPGTVHSAETNGKVILSVETNRQCSSRRLILQTVVCEIAVVMVLAVLLGCQPGKLYVWKIVVWFLDQRGSVETNRQCSSRR